ncbi:MAG: hypothetical protein QM776_06575 [Rhodocyclaceae bacterium]
MASLSVLLFVPSVQAQRADAIAITASSDAYTVTVPLSRLEMVLPRSGLVQNGPAGGAGNPRYFSFNDPSRGLVLSGWFEPATAYKGVAAFWESELAGLRRSPLPAPTDVSIERAGSWDAIYYQQPLPEGLKLKGSSAHLRAQWVQAGTWIDLHLSNTTPEAYATNRAALEDFLKIIIVREKPAN